MNGKPVIWGISASLLLLGIYFAVLTLVSGWDFALAQFEQFWYFILSLATGFGIQVGLYSYLRVLVGQGQGASRILGVTGTTSTAAMISCCTHYLANLLPLLGAAGVVTLVAQYQVELFWVGLIFNLAGILFLTKKIIGYQVKIR